MNERQCETCGQSPISCICLSEAQVAAYVTGGDNARWLKRPEKSEAA
jgi:hypothetical protein